MRRRHRCIAVAAVLDSGGCLLTERLLGVRSWAEQGWVRDIEVVLVCSAMWNVTLDFDTAY